MICFAVTVKMEQFTMKMLKCDILLLTGKDWMSYTACYDGLCCVTPC